MLNMYLQNLNEKKKKSRFELWKTGNSWEDQLELKQNWLDKSKWAYMELN